MLGFKNGLVEKGWWKRVGGKGLVEKGWWKRVGGKGLFNWTGCGNLLEVGMRIAMQGVQYEFIKI